MATILRSGGYPKENIKICPECKCEFAFYNSEVHFEMTTPDEEAFFGGYGSHKWVECPECEAKVIFDVKFTPTRDWLQKFCRNMKYIKIKRERKKRKK